VLRDKFPLPFRSSTLEVYFSDKSQPNYEAHYLTPVSVSDIASYVLGNADGGSGKTPMVVQALEKGADYLICLVPGLDGGLDEVVEGCFVERTQLSEMTYASPEARLLSLR